MNRYRVQFNVGLRNNPIPPTQIKGLLSVAIMDNNEDPIISQFFQGEWEGEQEQTLFVEFGKEKLTRLDLERIGRVATLCNQDCIAVRWRETDATWGRLVYRNDWKKDQVKFDKQYFKAPKQ
jgi:hypothetical protein